MKNLKYLLTLYLIFGLLFFNCSKEEMNNNNPDQCPELIGDYFDINGINSVEHLGRNNTLITDENTKISFNEYNGFLLDFSREYISLRHKPKPNNRLGNLYALSCLTNGYKGTKNETYKSISVITLNDFNNTFQAGDTINNILEVSENKKIEDIIFNSTNIVEPSLQFILTESPSINKLFKVRVYIELNNGEIYTKESKTIELI